LDWCCYIKQTNIRTKGSLDPADKNANDYLGCEDGTSSKGNARINRQYSRIKNDQQRTRTDKEKEQREGHPGLPYNLDCKPVYSWLVKLFRYFGGD